MIISYVVTVLLTILGSFSKNRAQACIDGLKLISSGFVPPVVVVKAPQFVCT